MPRQNVGRSLSITSQESYSAVIIADMVAEIPTEVDPQENVGSRQNSMRRGSNRSRKNSSTKKESVNIAYDDQTDTTPPAVVSVEDMETVNLGHARVNGTDISKGVILNAQFGDFNNKTDYLAATEKSIEMNNAHQPPPPVAETKKETKSSSVEFSQMSLPRKIAFVFSFLPSIMFVLCFAVILPCEQKLPCVEEMWFHALNDTVITSGLKISSERLFYSFYFEASGKDRPRLNGLTSLNVEDGSQFWEKRLTYKPSLVDCAKLVQNSTDACLVEEPSGAAELFNATTGDLIVHVNLTRQEEGSSATPVILPDCQKSGVAEFGIAASNQEIKIIYQGIIISTIRVSVCDSLPQKMTPLPRVDNQTDLIFVCQKDSKDQLVQMSQDAWCMYKKPNTGRKETKVIKTGEIDSLTQSILVPTETGLFVWSENEVTLFDFDGKKTWNVSTEPHSKTNRFLLHGRFDESGNKVALFSSDISSNLLITVLNPKTGETTWNKTMLKTEISDVSVIKGEKNDFVLMLMRKGEHDLKADAVTQLAEVPTTLMSLLSEEGMAGSTESPPSRMVEELVFSELGGSYFQTIDEVKMSYAEGESYKSSLTVVPRQNKGITVVVLKQYTTRFPRTQLRSIRVNNWDISLTENRQCSWKS
ncbi:uncharacterized protein NPIL_535081 [Nephila pilipes]|uniref:Uncharacterized protein n=1 Tax=Nephila pilipes TaxID=299642 RepID=A0A8X6UC10_NEPPI|nr:uncharacterized protein NPIL_535081 [Nephila pilipes]